MTLRILTCSNMFFIVEATKYLSLKSVFDQAMADESRGCFLRRSVVLALPWSHGQCNQEWIQDLCH